MSSNEVIRAIALELTRLSITDLDVSHPPDMSPSHVHLSCEDRDVVCDGSKLLKMLKAIETGAPDGAFDPQPGSVWHAINECEVIMDIINPNTPNNIVKKAPNEESDLQPSSRIERRIVWNLIEYLAAAGFAVLSVDDGEDIPCADANAAMEAIFAVGQARLFVRKPDAPEHWILLVLGNGEDVVSDWNFSEGDPDGFHAAMDAFKPENNW